VNTSILVCQIIGLQLPGLPDLFLGRCMINCEFTVTRNMPNVRRTTEQNISGHPHHTGPAIHTKQGSTFTVTTSKGWGENRHSTRFTSPVSTVSRYKLVPRLHGLTVQAGAPSPPSHGTSWCPDSSVSRYKQVSGSCIVPKRLSRSSCDLRRIAAQPF